MSGTSLDGVDVALLETDGIDIVRRGPALTIPYDDTTRFLLRASLREAPHLLPGATSQAIKDAEKALNAAHVAAVERLLREAVLETSDIAYVGFHGQTILHRPEQGRTWQIGDGAALADVLAINVVNDFRTRDVEAGGQGAPLVPLYHAALARALEGPVAVVNIGGVANVTYIDGDTLLAFDTGPGNAPMDDWAHIHTGEAVDRDGALARKGKLDDAVLTAMLDHQFFARIPPKSLDRLDFGTAHVVHMTAEDGAATLTHFTAASLARAAEHFPRPVKRWIVCGGGRHNPVLMEALRARLENVATAEDIGWRGDFLEAEAFAYLAMRSVKGLPLSLPTTTGVKMPMTGGTLHIA